MLPDRFCRFASTAILVLSALFPARGGDLGIQYREGQVSVRQADRWIPISIGDEIGRDAVLRLGPDSYLEMGDGTTKLKIALPGTYRIEDLLEAHAAEASGSLFSRIQQRLRRVLPGSAERDPTTAGTRADEAPVIGDVEWLGGESVAELIEEGRFALDNENIDMAIELFDEAALFATPAEEPEAAFYLGYSLFLSGESREALYWLQIHEPDSDTYYYHEHVITLAQSHLELSAADEAIGLLANYVQSSTREPELLPAAHLLMGIGYRMSGRLTRAHRELNRVVSIAPDSSEAAVATQLLSE